MRNLQWLQRLRLPHKAGPVFASYLSPLNPTWHQFWRSVDTEPSHSQDQTRLAGTFIHHDIGTLDPRHLSTLDYVDLSDVHRVKIGDMSDTGAPHAATLFYRTTYMKTRRERYKLREQYSEVLRKNQTLPKSERKKVPIDTRKHVPFPPQAGGFFYYYSSPRAPIAGAIRFRITQDGSPTSFASGTDLLLPSGLPWEVPIVVLGSASIASYAKLRQMLLRDGLVAQPLLDKCTELGTQEGASAWHDSRLLHSLGQPFYMEFDQHTYTFWLVGEDGLSVHPVVFKYFFKGMFHKQSPYSGSALCCFERSTLPQHAGTRTAVLRIVKIVDRAVPNLTYRGRLPREGKLHQRYDRVWSFNVDHPPPWAPRNNLAADDCSSMIYMHVQPCFVQYVQYH
ncbi:hypothetical protein A0H81_05069 [Grifola frondosa]|uniref:Uncharacterized protein n=1 Tax=Grifola frondosa TaxID=5627 RepID=A0A1C7MDJ5_GRIFR|nr:hypothetical protein A0H81_05069 [Grifola frondosa]